MAKEDYLKILSDSVMKRQSELSLIGGEELEEMSDSDEEQKQDKKSGTVTLNLESVILLENKLYRISQNVKHIR